MQYLWIVNLTERILIMQFSNLSVKISSREIQLKSSRCIRFYKLLLNWRNIENVDQRRSILERVKLFHLSYTFFSPSTWHVFQWSWYVDLLLVSYARDSAVDTVAWYHSRYLESQLRLNYRHAMFPFHFADHRRITRADPRFFSRWHICAPTLYTLPFDT